MTQKSNTSLESNAYDLKEIVFSIPLIIGESTNLNLKILKI